MRDDQEIKIRRVHINKKGLKDLPNDALMGCYFWPVGDGKYNLYEKGVDPDGTPLKTDISQSNGFSFTIGPVTWEVSGDSFLISDTAAHGDWTIPAAKDADTGGSDGESGTFTAQAGGSGGRLEFPEQAASSATA